MLGSFQNVSFDSKMKRLRNEKGNKWKLQKKVKEKCKKLLKNSQGKPISRLKRALDSQVIDIVFLKRQNFPKNTRIKYLLYELMTINSDERMQ